MLPLRARLYNFEFEFVFPQWGKVGDLDGITIFSQFMRPTWKNQ